MHATSSFSMMYCVHRYLSDPWKTSLGQSTIVCVVQTFQSSKVRTFHVLFPHIHTKTQNERVITKAGWWVGSNYYTEASWPHLGRTTVDHRLDPCLEHQEGVLSPESRVITCESSGGGEGKKRSKDGVTLFPGSSSDFVLYLVRTVCNKSRKGAWKWRL